MSIKSNKRGARPTSNKKEMKEQVKGLIRVHLFGFNETLYEEGDNFIRSTTFDLEEYVSICGTDKIGILRFTEGMLMSKVSEFRDSEIKDWKEENAIEVCSFRVPDILMAEDCLDVWEYIIRQFPSLMLAVDVFSETGQEDTYAHECSYILSNGEDGVAVEQYGPHETSILYDYSPKIYCHLYYQQSTKLLAEFTKRGMDDEELLPLKEDIKEVEAYIDNLNKENRADD